MFVCVSMGFKHLCAWEERAEYFILGFTCERERDFVA